jgi:hypothetical protein
MYLCGAVVHAVCGGITVLTMTKETTHIQKSLARKIRRLIALFIVLLVLSGITAFPIETQLAFAHEHISMFPWELGNWISTVYYAVKATNASYPYLSYGTDWLAFAHLVIAVAFIGPFRDPVKNIWVIQFGMISCLMVFPLAFIAGSVRHIPFYWQLIDCSFGVFGFLLLWLCYRLIRELERMQPIDGRSSAPVTSTGNSDQTISRSNA